MFQFDEDWDPEEERRDDEEYRRILGDEQKKVSEITKANLATDEWPKSKTFYDDYFAVDPAECENWEPWVEILYKSSLTKFIYKKYH
jgi:hypothetical protein